DPGLLRVLPGAFDRSRRGVDAGGGQPLRRVMDRVMAGAGARVQHLALDRAERYELLNDGLRAADVPWCGGGQSVCGPLVAVHLFEAIRVYGSSHAREDRPAASMRSSRRVLTLTESRLVDSSPGPRPRTVAPAP